MARRYFVSNVASGLGVGLDFSTLLLPNIQGGTSTATVSLAANTTRVSTVFTPPFHPSVGGAISDYAVLVEITTGDNQCALSLVAHRINSGGTIQVSSAATGEQIASVGTQTHTFANLNLGTWLLGDRLRIDYQFRNTQAHGGTRTVVTLLNSVDLTVNIPDWRGRKSRAT